MKILIDIGHPAHVHLFKNFIWNMKKKNHEILITTRDKDITILLLQIYDFSYINIGNYPRIKDKIISLFTVTHRLYKISKKFNPDIILGVGSIHGAFVSKLINKPCIAFEDTEHCVEQQILYKPFTTKIFTPNCFNKNLGKKQIQYNGYHELAYLHPNYFTPNPGVLEELGLSKGQSFFILRFVSWNASHDIRKYGINNKIQFVRKLEEYGKVFITSEGILDKNLEKYKINVSPDKIHDLLYYATLYIGEGATMASESAILGTPSIYISSLVGTMGNFYELENRYGLIFSYEDARKGLNKAIELIQIPKLKEEWREKREKLLNDKIDVTAFMIEVMTNIQKR